MCTISGEVDKFTKSTLKKRWLDVVKHLKIDLQTDFDWSVRNRRENSLLPLYIWIFKIKFLFLTI